MNTYIIVLEESQSLERHYEYYDAHTFAEAAARAYQVRSAKGFSWNIVTVRDQKKG